MKLDAKKTLKIGTLAVFFLIIIAFAFYRSHDLVFGVKVKNVSINGDIVQNGKKYENNIVNIAGNAKNAVMLTLNGREISINNAGDFNETIALLPGYNTLNITARDKFGYINQKNYELMY